MYYIYISTKYYKNHALDNGAEDLLCEDIKWVLQGCSSNIKKLNFNSFQNRSQIFKLVKKFDTHGICEDHRRMGAPVWTQRISPGFKSQLTRIFPDLCNKVIKNLESVSFVQCILIKELKLSPYWIQIRNQLTKANMEKNWVFWGSENSHRVIGHHLH